MRQATEARRRFSIETELRRALEKEQLRLFYQPLINLKSGEVAGFEALARWTHEDRGEISPSEFIPVAEESGLILELGRWAMDSALRTLADWDRTTGEALPCYVAVNLSAIQLARDDVPAMVADALKSSGINGNRLTLELTESSIVQDPARATRVFDALKALDATVAMDDFGTGYSSLAYLQRLPIDVLKIDKSFVCGMMIDPDAVAIVRPSSASPKRLACRLLPKVSKPSSWRRRWRRSAVRAARVSISPSRSIRCTPSIFGDRAAALIQQVGVTPRAGVIEAPSRRSCRYFSPAVDGGRRVDERRSGGRRAERGEGLPPPRATRSGASACGWPK